MDQPSSRRPAVREGAAPVGPGRENNCGITGGAQGHPPTVGHGVRTVESFAGPDNRQPPGRRHGGSEWSG